jgi:hypothetical protein
MREVMDLHYIFSMETKTKMALLEKAIKEKSENFLRVS